MEEAAVISRSADHMVDNPERRSGFPGMTSSLSTKSKQQKEGTNVEPCPAAQGKVQQAIITDILGKAVQQHRKQIRTRNYSPIFLPQQWAGTLAGP